MAPLGYALCFKMQRGDIYLVILSPYIIQYFNFSLLIQLSIMTVNKIFKKGLHDHNRRVLAQHTLSRATAEEVFLPRLCRLSFQPGASSLGLLAAPKIERIFLELTESNVLMRYDFLKAI